MPSVFFTASGQPTIEADLALFTEAVLESDIPDAGLFDGQAPATWDAALRLLARCLAEDRPSVVVLDEMPYLISTDAGFEGTLVVPPLSPADAAELLGLSPPDAFDAYTVADSHLRFWLAFLGPHQPEIERRRGDLVAAPISNQFPGSPKVIGSYWTRTNDPQVDLICADRGPVAKRIAFVGLVKWCDSQPFDERDLASMPNWRRRP